MITVCAPDRTLSLTGLCELVVPDMTGEVTATDNCGSITVTQSIAATTALPSGEGTTHTVTISVDDGNGNSIDVDQNVVDYYRGGYDESTVGGNLLIEGSTFSGCGQKEKSGTLINTYGIINVSLVNNSFVNNRVKLVARLWGAKNNSESGNTIQNSGKIITEQNLPMKLMY